MPRSRLTAAGVAKMKAPASGQVDWFDELLPGFGVRLSYNGTKSWFAMVRVSGKLIRSTLGRHPALSLAAARDKARNVKLQAEAGIDPRRVKHAAQIEEAVRYANTFEVVAKEFLQNYATPNLRPSTVREYVRALQGNDTAFLTSRPISEITKRDILSIVDRMSARGSTGAAGRTLAYLSKFFSWCVDRELLQSSPTDRIRSPQPTKSRDRVLSPNEIALVWRAFSNEGGLFGPLFKLLALTGQRRGEVAGMLWDELDDLSAADPIWRIPGTRTKNHQPHVVPLSPTALELLRALPNTGHFIFSTNARTPVSGFGKAKARIDAALTQHDVSLPAWTLHDLRRTMVTVMNEELRIQPHVVEAVVNHVSGSAKRGVAGVYNRALYLDERRQALNAWDIWLQATVMRSNIVALPA